MANTHLPFQPYCPTNGTFYVCNTPTSTFIGCCVKDPCSSLNGCPDGDLKPTSFNPQYYGTFPDQNCNDRKFYTCTATKPPFMGCCRSNACAGVEGCPKSDLEGMRLRDDPKSAAAFLGTEGASTTSPTSTSTAMPANIAHQTGLPVAAIGGIAVGGVLLALAMVLIFLWRRTVRLRKAVESSQEPQGQDGSDRLSGTTYPTWAHTDTAYKYAFDPSHSYSSLATSHEARQGRFSTISGLSCDSDPRLAVFDRRSPQFGVGKGMVHSPPFVPVQELEAMEQQMSVMDAGNAQSSK